MGNSCAFRDPIAIDPTNLSKYGNDLELARQNYEETRLREGQYSLETVKDNSKLSMISQFEETLPLRKIDVNEFERRVKFRERAVQDYKHEGA